MASNKRKAALPDDPRASKQATLDSYFGSASLHEDDAPPSKPPPKHSNNPFWVAKPTHSTPKTTTTSTTATTSTTTSNSDPKNKPTSNSTTVTSKYFTPNPASSTSTQANPKVTTNKTKPNSTPIEIPEYFDENNDFNLEDVLDDSKSLSSNNKTYDNKSNSSKSFYTTNTYKKSTYYDKYSKEDNGSYGKYVKMPYDPKNTYICPHTSEKRPKWELITTVLRETINSANEFQEALLTYNPTYRGEWSFVGLHQFINAMDSAEKSIFFSHTLPAIVELALSLPSLMTETRLPLLLPGTPHQVISLTQHQIASLLANAFLCTFPRRNKSPKAQKHYTKSYNYHNNNNGGADNMPSINFSGLFGKPGKAIVNKLHCILNYFRRVVVNASELGGRVDFERRQIANNLFPVWEDSKAKLQSLHVYSEGTIEDSDTNFLHVDFSNKYIGGGILGRGCVQEEIMFCIYPELIVARLFNAMLTDNECCIFTGAEKYSTHSGYSDSFVFLADYVDKTPSDDKNRKRTKYAMDQYDTCPILRELNKAYCAFFVPPKTVARPISTGNWGCGAFNGDLELKAVIQLMASAVCNRTLHYFTFENSIFANNLGAIHDFLVSNDITVGELWVALCRFCSEKFKRKEDQTTAAHAGVFNFLQLYFTK